MNDPPRISESLPPPGEARTPSADLAQLAILDFALNHVREAVYLIDAQGRFRYVNDESCRALGYSREELLRMRVPDIGPEYPLERWQEHWRELITRGSITFEAVHRTRDGREFPVEITANYFEYSGVGYNLALVRDVTEIRNSERQLRTLLDNMPDFVSRLDRAGRLTYVNPAVSRAFGIAPEEVVGRSVSEPGLPGDAGHHGELGAAVARVFTEARPNRVEVTWNTNAGPRIFEVRHVPELDRHGSVTSVLGIAQDITERKRAEQELQRNREALQDFSRQLATLHKVIMDLSRVETLNALCRQSVEFGRTRLDFERIGLWFIDEPAGLMLGTYGTDERGTLRDERDARIPFRQEGLAWEVFSKKEPVAHVHRGPLRDETHRAVGEGENAMAALWDGDQVIGVVAIDNLFSCRPITDRQLEILRFYATALGHLITRKRAEEALRKAEHDFRTLAENSPDIIIRYDRECRRTYVNPVYERDVGLSRADAVGVEPSAGPHWRANVPLEDYRARIRQVLTSGLPSEMTLQWSDPAGRSLIYSLRFAPEHDDSGEIIGCLVVGRNINDLVEVERRLSTLLENLPDLVLRADLDGCIQYLNPAAARTLGLQPGEFDRTTWGEALERRGAGASARSFAEIMAALREGKNGSWACTLDSPEGPRAIDLRFVPERDHAGSVVSILCIGRDVTEQKNSEEALRRQMRMNEALFSQAISPFVLLDCTGRFIRVNEAYARPFQRSPADFVGRTFLELFPTDTNTENHTLVEQVVQSRRPLHLFASPFAFADQPERGITYWDLILQPILDDRGEPEFIFFSSIDVTERKKAEDEVRRLNAELEERIALRTSQLSAANRELESFCYSVSHDLRTPLRSIDGFSRILLEDYAESLDDEGRDHLRRVRLASQRMDRLIDDLLALSRTARIELRRTPVDLSALACEIAAELQATAPAREVDWLIAPGLAAEGDRPLLRIVLENLLGNAWKFTSRRARARIEVGLMETPQGPAFFVRDNGAGFDMAHAAGLFGAFKRLHTVDEFPGTGVGLATVQRIVNRHGGRIWAESRPDAGATFRFTLSPEANNR